jgi:hypothetical protein
MDNTDRVSKLEREIKERMNELKELTLSDSDRAYASYLAAVDNCQDLWVKYIETLQTPDPWPFDNYFPFPRLVTT